MLAGGNAQWLGARMTLFSFCSRIKLHVAYLVRKRGHFCHAVTVLHFLDYSRDASIVSCLGRPLNHLHTGTSPTLDFLVRHLESP